MRRIHLITLCALLAGLTSGVTAQQAAPAGDTLTLEEVAERVSKAEAGLLARMRAFKPILEVYAQNVEPHDRLGTVPVRDVWFLGQFDWSDGEFPTLKWFTPNRTRQQVASWITRPFGLQLRADGFAAMAAPDWVALDAKRYQFTFLRREFLGEVRCLVFDVQPRGNPNDGFTGRIWVEDRDFNIVRFNGITRGGSNMSLTAKKHWFNVDSWRVNVSPGLWLPAYVYSEQSNDSERDAPKLKSQVRIWGYDLKSVRPAQEFTIIRIDEPAIQDKSAQPQQLSPAMSHRMWEQQAEDNVIERLSNAGLMAPPGDVDQVLETVVRNLQITNNLNIEPPVKTRVLLTSPLDSMAIGRTIALSRGLIDVLPDEASLAMMLAHELAHIALGHRVIDTRFSFADKLMVPDDELLAAVQYRHEPKQELEAAAKTLEYLKNSPYKEKLADAGLFLKALTENARKLRNLIQPHVVSHIADAGQVSRLNELIQQAPSLAPESLDQVAALSLGARILVDPWSSQLELLRAANVPLASAREKASLAVTPLVPYLRYAEFKQQTATSPQ
jgi:hypothetical protein